jgi:hypothetical protein
MSATQARQRVIDLATVDIDSAMHAARRIDDPWFACQALAWVARYSPENCVDSVADEAFSIGRRSKDEYQIVASAAWPLRALIERDRIDRIGPIIQEYLDMSSSIPNFASRSEALFLIFQAVFPAGRLHWLKVLHALSRSASPSLHWRQARTLRDAILITAGEDSQFAAEFCRNVTNPIAKRQSEQRLARLEARFPREFFWRTNRPA